MTSCAIATPHHLARDAGMRAMQAGGSAVDGAIAAAAVLTVVYPHNCALGGDLFAIVRSPEDPEQIFRDVRMGRFHPGNTLLAHELIGKLCLGINPDEPPRWG